MTTTFERTLGCLALLRRIASDEVAGVPGAIDAAELGPEQMGPLMLAGMVQIGVATPMNDPLLAEGKVPLTTKYVWLKPTDAGLAWLAAQEPVASVG